MSAVQGALCYWSSLHPERRHLNLDLQVAVTNWLFPSMGMRHGVVVYRVGRDECGILNQRGSGDWLEIPSRRVRGLKAPGT